MFSSLNNPRPSLAIDSLQDCLFMAPCIAPRWILIPTWRLEFLTDLIGLILSMPSIATILKPVCILFSHLQSRPHHLCWMQWISPDSAEIAMLLWGLSDSIHLSPTQLVRRLLWLRFTLLVLLFPYSLFPYFHFPRFPHSLFVSLLFKTMPQLPQMVPYRIIVGAAFK